MALWCGGAHGVVFVLDVVSHEVLLDQQLLDNWLKHCVDWLVIEAEELFLGLCDRGWCVRCIPTEALDRLCMEHHAS